MREIKTTLAGQNLTGKKVRLNADLAPDVAKALEALARKQNVSLSEAVRRAISTESFLQQKRDSGSKILVEDHGKIQELVFMR